jgi:hypothetical protein
MYVPQNMDCPRFTHVLHSIGVLGIEDSDLGQHSRFKRMSPVAVLRKCAHISHTTINACIYAHASMQVHCTPKSSHILGYTAPITFFKACTCSPGHADQHGAQQNGQRAWQKGLRANRTPDLTGSPTKEDQDREAPNFVILLKTRRLLDSTSNNVLSHMPCI